MIDEIACGFRNAVDLINEFIPPRLMVAWSVAALVFPVTI